MSLAARLCGFFLIAVGLLLCGFSVTLYLLARGHLHRDLDERLVSVLDQLAAAVIDQPGVVEWRPGRWTPAAGLHGGVESTRWAVFDARGVAVEKSWELSSADERQVLAVIPDFGHDHLTITALDGNRWRLAVRRLDAPPPRPDPEDGADDEDGPRRSKASRSIGLPYLELATGTPLEPVEANLRAVALLLAASSALLWTLAALAGRHACRRALEPMTRMSAVARSLSAADRGQHLPSPGTRDELEELAQAFNGLIDRLHEALARQNRFTGDASHQLRSPLTALLGAVEVARRRDRSPDEYRQVLDDVHADALHLGQIVEALLYLARAEAEAGHPDLVPLDLARWLPDHLRAWSNQSPGRDVRPILDASGPMVVRVHLALLGQLLDNLLDNAAKYGPPGGPIEVRLGRESGRVALAIEDRGPGLRPEDLPHLFEPFYRSREARRLGQPGVGLGLAVVQRIAYSLGGEAQAENRPGGGARFVARFPEIDTR